VPEEYRPQPGALDFGFCALWFSDVARAQKEIVPANSKD
jgi:hypothetical protein